MDEEAEDVGLGGGMVWRVESGGWEAVEASRTKAWAAGCGLTLFSPGPRWRSQSDACHRSHRPGQT